MSDKKMANCPKCHKPILNSGTFTSFAEFRIKCPWCQEFLEISIQPRITVQVSERQPVELLPYPWINNKAGERTSKIEST